MGTLIARFVQDEISCRAHKSKLKRNKPKRKANGLKLSQLFPSRYLKADDIDGDTPVIIKELVFDKMKDDEGKEEEKPVLLFKGVEKGLVLNKTNAQRIEDQHGGETDDWMGKRITLTTESVTAFGKTQWAIRVKPERPATGKGIKPLVAADDDSPTTPFSS